jgi:TolA-binding protein
MKALKLFILLMIILQPAFLSAQDKKDEKAKPKEPNLARIADDLKYQNGAQFLALKQHDRAIEVLQEYLEIYSDGIHRHEAYRGLAEIYFSRFNYTRAIEFYKGLYEEYSNTEDGVAAYYWIGICYEKMGYDSSAINVFKQIVTDYPQSTYAQQARMQMDMLKILAQ